MSRKYDLAVFQLLVAMEDTLRIINQMEAEHVIGRYAIAGAIGFLFYCEPALTEDLDIFCFLPRATVLITMEPLYGWAKDHGYKVHQEHIIIEGIPVQFLEPPSNLEEEALVQAADDTFSDVPTRVFQYEHLLAIACKLGRPKDKLRIVMALESRKPDDSKLQDILRRHNLLDKWSAVSA
jgi:hypothetical protein